MTPLQGAWFALCDLVHRSAIGRTPSVDEAIEVCRYYIAAAKREKRLAWWQKVLGRDPRGAKP